MSTQTKAVGLLVIAGLICARLAGSAIGDSIVAREFDQAYAAWRTHILSPEVRLSSTHGPYVECPEFQAMVQLGIPALELAVAKARQEPDTSMFMGALICRVTAKRFAPEEDPIAWWETGLAETGGQFRWLLEQWEGARTGDRTLLWVTETSRYAPTGEESSPPRKVSEAGKVYAQVRDMGIAALPYLAEAAGAGKRDWLTIADELTDGQALSGAGAGATPEEKATAFVAWWKANKEQWLLPPLKDATPYATAPPVPVTKWTRPYYDALGTPRDATEARWFREGRLTPLYTTKTYFDHATGALAEERGSFGR